MASTNCCCSESCECPTTRADLPASLTVHGETFLRADWTTLTDDCCWTVERNVTRDWICESSAIINKVEWFRSWKEDWYAAEPYFHVGQTDPPEVCTTPSLFYTLDNLVYGWTHFKLWNRYRITKIILFLYKTNINCGYGVQTCKWVLVVRVNVEYRTAQLGEWDNYTNSDFTSHHTCAVGSDNFTQGHKRIINEFCTELNGYPLEGWAIQREIILDPLTSSYTLTKDSQLDNCTQTSACKDFITHENLVFLSQEYPIPYPEDYFCDAFTYNRICRRLWFFVSLSAPSGAWYWEGQFLDGFDELTESIAGHRKNILFAVPSNVNATTILTRPDCWRRAFSWPPGTDSSAGVRDFGNPAVTHMLCSNVSNVTNITPYTQRQLELGSGASWPVSVTW